MTHINALNFATVAVLRDQIENNFENLISGNFSSQSAQVIAKINNSYAVPGVISTMIAWIQHLTLLEKTDSTLTESTQVFVILSQILDRLEKLVKLDAKKIPKFLLEECLSATQNLVLILRNSLARLFLTIDNELTTNSNTSVTIIKNYTNFLLILFIQSASTPLWSLQADNHTSNESFKYELKDLIQTAVIESCTFLEISAENSSNGDRLVYLANLISKLSFTKNNITPILKSVCKIDLDEIYATEIIVNENIENLENDKKLQTISLLKKLEQFGVLTNLDQLRSRHTNMVGFFEVLKQELSSMIEKIEVDVQSSEQDLVFLGKKVLEFQVLTSDGPQQQEISDIFRKTVKQYLEKAFAKTCKDRDEFLLDIQMISNLEKTVSEIDSEIGTQDEKIRVICQRFFSKFLHENEVYVSSITNSLVNELFINLEDTNKFFTELSDEISQFYTVIGGTAMFGILIEKINVKLASTIQGEFFKI